MTRVSLCGGIYHPINSCRLCRNRYERDRNRERNEEIAALRQRVAELESILAGHRPRCPSCHVRTRVVPLPLAQMREYTGDRSILAWLQGAARWFDAESDERFTATEFVAWVKPDLSEKAA